MNRKRKILAGALTAALLLSLSIPAFATSGDVAGAVEQTWTSAFMAHSAERPLK